MSGDKLAERQSRGPSSRAGSSCRHMQLESDDATPELKRYYAIVFDPPRAGAESQALALGASPVPLVVAVSCNARTFARDAAILCAGGYEITRVEPVDQFRHTPHVEIVAGFRRRTQGPRKNRRLLD